jgi:acyl carrier protein
MNTKILLRSFMLHEFKDSGFHEGIGDDDSLIESNVLDSLSILKLIGYLDERFHVILDEDELKVERLGTISKIASLIEKKQASYK